MTGPVRQELLDVALTGPVARAHVSRVELAPGQAAGRHRHPCDVVGHIVSGTVRYRPEDGPETTLAPGDAFHEPALAPIARFDNASATEPVVFVACYLLPPGQDRLIEMLDPPG
jgi:quercetin dioxygenase-like cupin family protein